VAHCGLVLPRKRLEAISAYGLGTKDVNHLPDNMAS